MGLNSIHFSHRPERYSTNVGVPRAIGSASGKSFCSTFIRIRFTGKLGASSLAICCSMGRMRKQRKHVSSYSCTRTGRNSDSST